MHNTVAAIRPVCACVCVHMYLNSSNKGNQFLCVCVGVYPCVSTTYCKHVDKNPCFFSASPRRFVSLHPASCPNSYRRSTETAGFCRSNERRSRQINDPTSPAFPPNQKKTATTCVKLSATLSLSLSPSCRLNALLPTRWKWTFVLLLVKSQREGRFTENCPLHWCWNIGITYILQSESVYREQQFCSSLQEEHICNLKTKHLKDARSDSDGLFWCLPPHSHMSKNYSFIFTYLLYHQQV